MNSSLVPVRPGATANTPVHSPFGSADPQRVRRWLTEDDFAPHFSLLQRLYYDFARPWVPIPVRQRLQRRYWSRLSHRPDFIDPEFADWAAAQPGADGILSRLFPGGQSCAVSLTHDVETGDGLRFVPAVMDVEEKYGFRSSWNIVPYKYPVDRGLLEEIRRRGHEIGIHGYNHDGRLYFSERIFRERARHINRALHEFGAVGFRSPMVHRNLEWLQQLEIEYDASCFDYDPYQPFPGGVKSIWPFVAGRFVELPYTLPQDHTLFHVLGGTPLEVWKRKADWVASRRGVVLSLTHPDYLRPPGHLAAYEGLLEHLAGYRDAWRCLPRELSAWWRQQWGGSPERGGI
jgi:peptidoglycan/xylan/chitin deacetylase (PgdA/CDA1 family)